MIDSSSSPKPTKPDVRGQYRFKTWISGGKQYKQAWGWLGMPGQVREFRSSSAQRGVAGGSGEDAGHLIGNRFGSPGGVENLSPQNWKANRYGTYKDLEDRWARERLAGIDIFVQVTDVTKSGDVRPFMRNVQWTSSGYGRCLLMISSWGFTALREFRCRHRFQHRFAAASEDVEKC